MDTVTKEKRSKIMSAIHSRDTLPEVVVRKMLWANGYRFRVCDRRIVGHPDVVIPKCRALIEVRGCFWHHHGWEWDGRKLVQTATCPSATAPKTNRAFWNAKFRRNVREMLVSGCKGNHFTVSIGTSFMAFFIDEYCTESWPIYQCHWRNDIFMYESAAYQHWAYDIVRVVSCRALGPRS